MSIVVRIAPILQEMTGGQEAIEVNNASVFKDVLDQLEIQFPGIVDTLYNKKGVLNNIYDIYVNGESVCPDELIAQIVDGDEISITMFTCFMRSG